MAIEIHYSRLRRAGAAALLSAIIGLAATPFAEAQQPGDRGRQSRPETTAPAQPGNSQSQPAAGTTAPAPLPADKTTSHTIRIGDREIRFTATAGAISLTNEGTGAITARLGYIAFTRIENEPNSRTRARPVTFAWNGGPGYASAWLNLGAMGPWRLDMDGAAAQPSAPPVTSGNAETWLDFTDLVFIDPAGTGFGRIPGGEDARKLLWSVDGDIASIATAIRRWLVDNNRMSSPKYLAGESYGGFRAPKIARRLQTDEGVGVNGLVLVSPVLDFGRFLGGGLLSHVARLPSYLATAREKEGAISHQNLQDVEAYAQGEFLADLMKGMKDQNALQRLSANVSRLTGLDRTLVARYAGRVPMNVFVREIHAGEKRVASMYDGNATGLDPNPFTSANEAEDQLLRGLHAPIVSAMIDIYQNRLQWLPANGRYAFQNRAAGRQWDWGNRTHEATSDLAASMALDSAMRVLVVHGLTDLVTPYFETSMVLDQMPSIGHPGRLKFRAYSGGHMFYSRTASRKAFRDDAQAMIAGQRE